MTNALWSVIVGVGEHRSSPPLVLVNMPVALEFTVINTKINVSHEIKRTQTPWGRMVIPNLMAPGGSRGEQPAATELGIVIIPNGVWVLRMICPFACVTCSKSSNHD